MAKSFRQIIGVSPSTASTKDSVLIIIDAQNEYIPLSPPHSHWHSHSIRYINGQLATANIESTRNGFCTLLKKYREAKAPIIHITHSTPDGAPVFTPSTDLAKPFDELTPLDSEVLIKKNYPGAFTGTDLEEKIKETGKKQVVLVGYMAHVCVSTTARQAAERGLDVVVVKGAVGDRDIPGVDAETLVKVVLAELEDAFASVVEVGDIQ